MAEIKGLMQIEVKAEDISAEGGFIGTLSTYGNIDAAGDVCEPHCFDNTIAEDGTRRPLLWQHIREEPIGHFDVTDTIKALDVDGKFNLDTQRGREAYSLLKNGDINGLSIGYIARDYTYDSDGIRHLLDVELLEGSLVSIPCNNLARAQAKSRRLAMSEYASCKFLSKLSAKDRDEALAELDALGVKATDDDAIGERAPEEPEKEPQPEDTPAEDESKENEKVEETDETEDDLKACIENAKKAFSDLVKFLEEA